MLDMLLSQWTSFAISAAAKLGIADQLESGPRTTQELAGRLNLHEDALYRLLRALAGSGIFHEGEGRLFSQTPLSDLLRTNAYPGLRYAAAMLLDDWHHKAFQLVCTSIGNGRTGMENAFNVGLFVHLQNNPQEAVYFNKSMTDMSSGEAPAVVASYDFSGFEHIVDVAGGMGGLLAAILGSSPKLRGTLFDLPSVIEQAGKGSLLAPFDGRCQLTGGSFFDGVPTGADAYIMKHIIHDWDDTRAMQILVNCRKAMKPNGKLLVVDRVIGPPNAPDPKKYFDLAMLMVPGGRERDEAEWRALFTTAGFHLERIIPTQAPQSILEGRPV
jgi:hypothetical protein